MNYLSKNIIDYLALLYGDINVAAYEDLIQSVPNQYIRVNELKTSVDALIKTLKEKYNIVCSKLPGYQNIIHVEDTNNLLGKTLEHILGYYYIQSFSSFIPPIVLDPTTDCIVLDLCAAPGSKTTEIGELMLNKGTIVANEIQLDRIKSLVYNIDRINLMNAGVLHFKGEQLSTIYNEYFDKILLDAPCSGLGIVYKKNEVNDWWSLERVRRLSELQLKLLVGAIKMLKVGGEIVYSTCTLTVEENELVIDKILNKYPVEAIEFNLPCTSHEGITVYNGQKFNSSISKAKRILPWDIKSDGFFIIKLVKTNHTQPSHQSEIRQQVIQLLEFNDSKINPYIKTLGNYFSIKDEVFEEFKFILKSNDIYFINNKWTDLNPGIFTRIGTRFGTINKDGKIILNTQAAQVLSDRITLNNYEIKNSADLNTYFAGGTIKGITPHAGQCVVKYGNYTLGTGVFTKDGLKSQFPRARRTQEIILV